MENTTAKEDPAKPSSDGTCHFFKLPPELRLTIYELAIQTTPPKYASNLGHLPIRPAIVSVCRTTRLEAMEVYVYHILTTFITNKIEYFISAEDNAEAGAAEPFDIDAYCESERAFWAAMDECVRSATCVRTEIKRLSKAGWPVDKWVAALESANSCVREHFPAGEILTIAEM